MPNAVSGLIDADAPCRAVVPGGRGKQSVALATRYCAYIPSRNATVRPRKFDAFAPASMTTPAPSLPVRISASRRDATSGIRAGAMSAVSFGRAAVPLARSVDRSAGPSSNKRSAGLIGEASTRIRTSSSASTGSGTSSSHKFNFASEVIFDRNSNPWLADMFVPRSNPFSGLAEVSSMPQLPIVSRRKDFRVWARNGPRGDGRFAFASMEISSFPRPCSSPAQAHAARFHLMFGPQIERRDQYADFRTAFARPRLL